MRLVARISMFGSFKVSAFALKLISCRLYVLLCVFVFTLDKAIALFNVNMNGINETFSSEGFQDQDTHNEYNEYATSAAAI